MNTHALAHRLIDEAEEVVGDSCGPTSTAVDDVRLNASAPGGGCSASLSLLSLQRVSPVTLRCSASSTALSKMSAQGEEEEEPQTPSYSPALQASVAAWQSANSLLQELQHMESPVGGMPSPPATMGATSFEPLRPGAAPPHLLLLTPEQQRERQPMAPWLHAQLAQGAAEQAWREAASPERQLPAASDAAAATTAAAR